MNWIEEFRTLKPGSVMLVMKAAALLVAIRLGLWVFPFGTVRNGLAHLSAGQAGSPSDQGVKEVVWATRAVARFLPLTRNCLAQALGVEVFLARRGCRAELRIGVASRRPSGLDAHAWLESGGEVVIGEAGMGRYTALPPLGDQDR